MKKIYLLFAACAFSAASIAQEVTENEVLKTKNGNVILPEAGDYALGFNAVPLLDFALNTVNIMNNTGQTAQNPGYVNGFNQVVVGKYFLKDDLAIRGRFGINNNRTSTKNYGDDLLGGTDPDNVLLSTEVNSSSNYFLSGGLEYRRGHNRLQGYYGGEMILGLRSSVDRTSYEFEYNQELADSGAISTGDSRTLLNRNGTTFMIGARGFVGVEYFVAPKISLGAEFGWGLAYSLTTRGKTETEFWAIENPSDSDPSQFTEEVKGNSSSSGIGANIDDGFSILGGSAALSVHFHF